MQSLSDEELYLSVLSGGDDALAELLSRYREGLTLFICQYVGSPEDAEELMLDAFAEMASGLTRFRGQSAFRTWLFAIGRNKAVSFLRRKRLSFFRLHEEQAGELSAPGPEFSCLRQESRAELYSAMEKLNDDYRRALYLIYFEGMSYSDAAAVMGKSEKQLTNLAYRGKARLRELLTLSGADFEELLR